MRALRSTAMIVSVGALATAGVAFAQEDEASKEPSAILSDAARDTGKLKSYHLDGTIADKTGKLKVAADIFASGAGRMSLVGGGMDARFIALKGKVYVKANAGFWRDAGDKELEASLVRKLAGRWIVESGSDGVSASSLFSEFRPKHIAACFTGGVGTLRKAGTATVGGQPAIVLKDAGDKPGTAPSTYYFSATGPTLLLRAVQTGKAKPGKAKDPRCSDSDGGNDTTPGSVLALSRFDKAAKVTAPHGAVTVKEAIGGSGSGSGDGGGTTTV